jgi:phenylacetate-CoA ligase
MNTFLHRQGIKLYQGMTGRRFLDRLDELNRTQWLSRDELLALQREKLVRLLEYAYAHVPYYRKLFDEVGFHPADFESAPEGFREVPPLTKGIIRENFDDLITTEDRRRREMSRLTTGGSTGQPLIFMQDSDFRDYVTADIHRHLGWAGWELGQPHAYIWGASFEVTQAHAWRTRLMDLALNRFVTNAYVLSEESMNAFADRLRRRKPRLLFGYPSSIFQFAEFARQHDMDDLTFDGIFSSAEVLFDTQRQYIEGTFDCKMFNRYGTRELGGVGCECNAHTGLHLSVENNYVEILQDGESAPIGEAGDIIVTNLNNYGMPFIRYCIEDIGAWHPDDTCPCGRALPMMELVQGRRIDMFRTQDGRMVWGGFASPMFGMPGVKQFQVVQKSVDLIVARIVKEGDLDQSKLDGIERTAKLALGDSVQVKFEFVDEIPRRASGKYLYAISELDDSPEM